MKLKEEYLGKEKCLFLPFPSPSVYIVLWGELQDMNGFMCLDAVYILAPFNKKRGN